MILVAHHWDGRPLDAPVARLDVRPGPVWRLDVEARYFGDPPPPAPPGPTDRLWEYEVVELFVVGEDDRYTEIELGPHGHHLVLQLEGVRRPVRTHLPLAYRAVIDGDRWRGTAVIDGALMPAPRRWNAFAVNGLEANRRHLAAVPVPGPAPDFHRLDAFAPWPPRAG